MVRISGKSLEGARAWDLPFPLSKKTNIFGNLIVFVSYVR
jgi:hypothetical protein